MSTHTNKASDPPAAQSEPRPGEAVPPPQSAPGAAGYSRLDHLKLVLEAIKQLKDNSYKIKGFATAILTAVLGTAFKEQLPLLCIAAVILALGAGIMDYYTKVYQTYYEHLYEEVRKGAFQDYILMLQDDPLATTKNNVSTMVAIVAFFDEFNLIFYSVIFIITIGAAWRLYSYC
jgi:hypothetical protein